MTAQSPGVVPHRPLLDRAERWAALGTAGATVWFTGLPAAGKSTVAYAVEVGLVAAGRSAYVLDGDNLRHGLNGDLGFEAADRAENVRRLGHVAALLADAGVVALVAAVSPFRAERDAVRRVHEAAGLLFVEVHVATPVAVCADRDPKGLYRRARLGELRGLTGVDAPYEAPLAADLVVGADGEPVVAQVAAVLDRLRPDRTG